MNYCSCNPLWGQEQCGFPPDKYLKIEGALTGCILVLDFLIGLRALAVFFYLSRTQKKFSPASVSCLLTAVAAITASIRQIVQVLRLFGKIDDLTYYSLTAPVLSTTVIAAALAVLILTIAWIEIAERSAGLKSGQEHKRLSCAACSGMRALKRSVSGLAFAVVVITIWLSASRNVGRVPILAMVLLAFVIPLLMYGATRLEKLLLLSGINKAPSAVGQQEGARMGSPTKGSPPRKNSAVGEAAVGESKAEKKNKEMVALGSLVKSTGVMFCIFFPIMVIGSLWFSRALRNIFTSADGSAGGSPKTRLMMNVSLFVVSASLTFAFFTMTRFFVVSSARGVLREREKLASRVSPSTLVVSKDKTVSPAPSSFEAPPAEAAEAPAEKTLEEKL